MPIKHGHTYLNCASLINSLFAHAGVPENERRAGGNQYGWDKGEKDLIGMMMFINDRDFEKKVNSGEITKAPYTLGGSQLDIVRLDAPVIRTVLGEVAENPVGFVISPVPLIRGVLKGFWK